MLKTKTAKPMLLLPTIRQIAKAEFPQAPTLVTNLDTRMLVTTCDKRHENNEKLSNRHPFFSLQSIYGSCPIYHDDNLTCAEQTAAPLN
ncbi:hypothetical protein O5D80_006860 [Batrachochytrium dendrobatidis]|nr:hypothetical protein O5D80_006860 [Batrachochytrium dendrobatidis]